MHKKNHKKIIGFFSLGDELFVTRECIGQRLKIDIKGLKGYILFPEFSNEEKFIQPKTSLSFAEEINWGWYRKAQDGSEYTIFCSFIIELNLEENQTVRSSKIIDEWVDSFIENLYLKDVIIQRETNSVDLNNGYKSFYSIENNVNKPLLTKEEPLISNFKKKITLEDIKEVCEITSYNKHLTEEMQLLRKSELSGLDGNYRIVILDSATAVEIYLSKLLNSLIQSPTNEKDILLKSCKSIYKKETS